MATITPEAREAADHDKWVSGLSRATLLAASADLGKRRAHDRRNPEHRWVMSRRAAIQRQLLKLNP